MSTQTIPVTVENFLRAESDMYFNNVCKNGGFGKFFHYRQPMPIDKQDVVRANRDTLYSAAVFDLDAGPVTIVLPDAGTRFRSFFVLNEDEYIQFVAYDAGSYTITPDQVGTRYGLMGIRTLVDPEDPTDIAKVHALQDATAAKQAKSGSFEIPRWDPESQKRVREALLMLSSTLPDSRHAFGSKDEVDPIRHLILAASAWGGNRDQDALYLNVFPEKNDGKTVYRLQVKDVPVDGFWSISVYNAEGYFEPNAQNAYSLNNLTAKKSGDATITVQFGGCDSSVPNCLPTAPGWNYIVRLYRPRPEVLNGSWTFPEAVPI